MTNHHANLGIKQLAVEATVIRANGTVEHLGTVAYWHRNPLRRWTWAAGRWLRGLRAGSVRAHT